MYADTSTSYFAFTLYIIVTKINGDTITYDKSVNPLSYRDGMTMTLVNDRKLSSLQTEYNEVNYKCNSNGMRT